MPSTITPDASIVVTSFRGATPLPQLFEALEEQTSTSYESIAAIDGDRDGSTSIVEVRSDRISVRAVLLTIEPKIQRPVGP